MATSIKLIVSDTPMQLSQGDDDDDDNNNDGEARRPPTPNDDFGSEFTAVKANDPKERLDRGGMAASALVALSKNQTRATTTTSSSGSTIVRPPSSAPSRAPVTQISKEGKKRAKSAKKAAASSADAKTRKTGTRTKHNSLIRKDGEDDRAHLVRLKHTLGSSRNTWKRDWCFAHNIEPASVNLKGAPSELAESFLYDWDEHVRKNAHLSLVKGAIRALECTTPKKGSRSRSLKKKYDKLTLSPSKSTSAKMDRRVDNDNDSVDDNRATLKAEIDSADERAALETEDALFSTGPVATEVKSPVLVPRLKDPDPAPAAKVPKRRTRSVPRRQAVAEPAPARPPTPPTQALNEDTDDEVTMGQPDPPSPSFSPVIEGDQQTSSSTPPPPLPPLPPTEPVVSKQQQPQPAIAATAVTVPTEPVNTSKSVGKRGGNKKKKAGTPPSVVPDTSSDAEMAKRLQAEFQPVRTRKTNAGELDAKHIEAGKVSVTPGNPDGDGSAAAKHPKSVLSTYMKLREFRGGKVKKDLYDLANGVIAAAKQRKDTDVAKLVSITMPTEVNRSTAVNVANMILATDETIGRLSDERDAAIKELRSLKETAAATNPVSLEAIKTQIEPNLSKYVENAFTSSKVMDALRSMVRDEVGKLAPVSKKRRERKERTDVDDDDTPIPVPKRHKVSDTVAVVDDEPLNARDCIVCKKALDVTNVPVLRPEVGHRDCVCASCRYHGRTVKVNDPKYKEYSVVRCVTRGCKNTIYVRLSRGHTPAVAYHCDLCETHLEQSMNVSGRYQQPKSHRTGCTCEQYESLSRHWNCAHCNCFFADAPDDLGAICRQCRTYIGAHGYNPGKNTNLELTACISMQKCTEVTLVAKGYVGWFCTNHIAGTCGREKYNKLKGWMSQYRNAHVDSYPRLV
jgi:hypothetical protein